MEGLGDTSLIHAIKGSSEYVYSSDFSDELRRRKHFSRIVIDAAEPALEADRWQIGPSLDAASPTVMPEIVKLTYAPYKIGREVIRDARVFGGLYREIAPRLNEEELADCLGLFMKYCNPNDAAEVWDFRQLPGRRLASW